MKKYEVVLKNINGTEITVIIEARNEGDARWSGKKIDGIYEACAIRRSR